MHTYVFIRFGNSGSISIKCYRFNTNGHKIRRREILMEYIYKEVNFTKYCPLCEDADTYEEKDPCNECLGFPMNEHSEKPVYFKPKKK